MSELRYLEQLQGALERCIKRCDKPEALPLFQDIQALLNQIALIPTHNWNNFTTEEKDAELQAVKDSMAEIQDEHQTISAFLASGKEDNTFVKSFELIYLRCKASFRELPDDTLLISVIEKLEQIAALYA